MSRLSVLERQPLTVRREPVGARLAAYAKPVLSRPWLVVGAIVLISAAVAAVFSLKITGYEPDELGYTRLATAIARSLTPFTQSYGWRLNQLYPLLIAPFWGFFGNVTAFRLAHVWNALLVASVAIPVYLLAREVVRERWAAYLAAALAAAAPWLTLSTSELTEVAAYPACAWALLAMQRSLANPSPMRDVVALLAIVVASYGRLQLIVLVPVLVIAMLIHELGYALRARELRRTVLVRLTRGHAVLSSAALIGIVIGVPLLISGELAGAAGFYGSALAGVTINGATFDLARSYLVFIGLGLGIMPAILALGFAVESFVAPISRRAHAFASLLVVGVLALTLQVAEISVRFNDGTLQERYLLYIVPLLIVGMSSAMLAARRPVRALPVGSMLFGLLVATTHYETARTAFWYQISPATTSFYDWVAPVFGAPGGPRAVGGAWSLVPTGVVVVAIGLVTALALRWIRSAAVLMVVGVVVVIFCSVETTHALYGVVYGGANGGGFGGQSLRRLDWVDRRVGASRAEQLDENVGGLANAQTLWEDDAFWNRSVDGAYTVGGFVDRYLPTLSLHVDPLSGAMTLVTQLAPGLTASRLSPSYLVVPARGFPVLPSGRVVAYSPSRALELVRVSPPLHAAWATWGVSPDGWLPVSGRAELDLYTLRGAVGHCLAVAATFSLDAVVSSPRLITASAENSSAGRMLGPGKTETVDLRVCGRANSVPRVRFAASQPPASDDPQLTPRLVRISAAPA